MVMQSIEESVNEFIKSFPYRKVDGLEIDDLLSYRGSSIWWYFKNRLEGDHLPLHFNGIKKIVDSIKDDRPLPEKKFKYFLLRKAYYYNEKIKRIISHLFLPVLPLQDSKNHIFCFVPTNRLYRKNGVVYIDRIEKVLKEIDGQADLKYFLRTYDPQSRAVSGDIFNQKELIYGHITKKDQQLASINAKKIHKQWISCKKSIELSNEIDKKIFFSLMPLLNFIYSYEVLFWIIIYHEAFHKILAGSSTKLVLMDSFGGLPERILISVANDKGITCLRLLHGGLYLPTRTWEYPANCEICVHNQEVKDALVKQGANSDKVHVVGATFLEDLPSKRKKIRMKKKIILCTTSLVEENVMNKEDYFSLIRSLLLDIKKIANDTPLELVIKTHPSEKHLAEYEKIIHTINFPCATIINSLPKDELYSLLNDSDLVITFFSTVLLESSLLDVTTILIEHDGLPRRAERFTFQTSGIIRFNPHGSVVSLLRKYLNDENAIMEAKEIRSQFVKSFFYKNDGDVGKRVVKVIRKILSHNKQV